MNYCTKLHIYLVPLTLFLFLSGCKKDLTPADNTQPQIKLIVEDVGVTEAWLRLNIQNPIDKNQITITRDTVTLAHFNTITQDTLIYDSGLLPNQNYTYTAASTGSASERRLLSEVEITTMDTTSHDFTWQSWTFGAKGSSILFDVAIIDENNIWAVGEIYTEDTYTYDSLGNWIDPYNAVHWDGNEWILKRILTKASFGEPRYVHLRSIFAFSENDIWITNYIGGYGHWNGTEWETDWKGVGENKIWGTSSSNLYFVGSVGIISHFNGQTWQRIESGANENINDIWGVSENDSQFILVTASNKYSTGDTKLLRINEDNTVTDENWLTNTRDPYSVWFTNSKRIFVCGAGIFTRNLYKQWYEYSEVPLIYTNRIRGNNINDIFVAGDSGLVIHYNGISWRIYNEAAIALFRSMDYKDDIIVAVGESIPKATILMGLRQ